MDPTKSDPSPLSIGLYSPGWPVTAFRNGIVTSVTTLAQALRAMGHQVTVLAGQVADGTSCESIYDMQEGMRSRGITRRLVDPIWYRVAPRSALASAARQGLLRMVRRAHAERRIELIDMEESFGWARWIRERTSIPLCVRLHGPWFLNGSALGVPHDAQYRKRVHAEGEAIQSANAVTAPSRNVLEQVRGFYGLPLPTAEVIPNPTLPVPVAERWRLEDCDASQVLFIGRFDRHKGGDLIIEAFRHVLDVVPQARLCFVGPDHGIVSRGGERWDIEKFIRNRIPGALETGRIEWLGQQPYSALANLRRRAMVTVVCSRYETFSMTAVEASALGCPVVAANVGAIPEIVQDGINGLLHQPEDSADIAAKVIRLMQDPSLAAQLGQQAAADCERRFYPDVVARQLVDFYRQFVVQTPRQA